MTNEVAHQQLADQLSKEAEARSMAVQRMQEAELRLQQAQFGGRQAPPAMREKLMELRQRLGQQEEASSMTMSSRTSEMGWEHVGLIRVIALLFQQEQKCDPLRLVLLSLST